MDFRILFEQLPALLLPDPPAFRILEASDADLRASRKRREAGAPFIQKPFTPDSLVAKIREVLDVPSA